MERAELLIEKLGGQLRQQAGLESVMTTLRLLHAEVLEMYRTTDNTPTDKRISVILPGMEGGYHPAKPSADIPAKSGEKIVEVLQVDQQELEAELQSLREAADLRNELALTGKQSVLPEADILPEPIPETVEVPSPAFREVNQAMVSDASSLNDRLKGPERELSERLQDEPVRDLKKAIGINDRYLYINELFKGSEEAFDQAVKTLNGFSILPEALYYLERELSREFGWKADDKLALEFTQLVRRRFA
jgi:hypothetical protein